MRLIALAAAVLGVLTLASDRALADGALSRPMAAHVAAQQAVLHTAHGGGVAAIHQVSDRHHGRRGYRGHPGYYGRSRHYGHPGFHYGRGPMMVYPPAPRYPAVVVPYAYPYSRSYYYQPYRSFHYNSPRFSIGIGF